MDDLLLAACRGDRDAFARLVSGHETKLFRTALAITGNRADAEDAWQNTVLNAFRGIRRLREPRYFQTWLTRILLNECKQVLRARRYRYDTPPPEAAQSAAMEADRVDVEAALSELPPEQREVIVLRFWLGMTLSEIADLTAVPEGTAKTRLYQALRKLRVRLEEVL